MSRNIFPIALSASEELDEYSDVEIVDEIANHCAKPSTVDQYELAVQYACVQVIMLERLIEQRDAVTLVLGGVPTVKNLSPQQRSTAADLAATLRPFMDVTQEMCGASYPTISMVIPVVDGLKNMLETTRGGLDILRDVLRRLLTEKFATYLPTRHCAWRRRLIRVSSCFHLTQMHASNERETRP